MKAVLTATITITHVVEDSEKPGAIHDLARFYEFAGQVESVVAATKYPVRLKLEQEGDINTSVG